MGNKTQINGTSLSRRRFLGTAVLGLGAPFVVPASALGLNGTTAPSNRITLGCIGVGGMGMGNMNSFLRFDDVQVIAVCDVDQAHLNAAQNRVTQHYAAATESGSPSGCDAYEDFRDVIARDDIDALMIATPDHWHTIPVIMAVQKGMDVYCEKPLSLTIPEGRAMVNAVKRYGRILQTGTWRRSRTNCRFGCELVRNGRIGKLHTIKIGLPKGYQIRGGDFGGIQPPMPVPEGFNYDFWLGPAPWAPYTPGRCHFNFRWIMDYSEGYISDWGAHYFDVAQWGNGTDMTSPVSVQGKGVFPKEGLYDAAIEHHIEYTYANGVKMICSTDLLGAVRFEGTEGWVHVDTGPTGLETFPESLRHETIAPGEIHLYESADHHRNFIDCIKTRRETAAPAEVGHRSAALCHLGSIAVVLERPLKWDPEKECFPDDSEAQRLLARSMRSPWNLRAL